MSVRRCPILLLFLSVVAGCRTGRNYVAADGPRYAGAASPSRTDEARRRSQGDTIRIVSFNIEFGRRIDGAIELLDSHEGLRGADLILLQEMDGESTRRVAEKLGLSYVYYPAIFHLRAKRDFGNAVLSRWPIVEDAKIVLPHVSRYARTQRTATAASIRVGESVVRVYSTHLSTIADVGSAARRDQLRAILADAASYPRVVIGGDMNSRSVGDVARESGYTWPTERGANTTRLGRWDHIFWKGFASPDSGVSGTVLDARGISDHRPVWAVGLLR